jgi:hypothetical protein
MSNKMSYNRRAEHSTNRVLPRRPFFGLSVVKQLDVGSVAADEQQFTECHEQIVLLLAEEVEDEFTVSVNVVDSSRRSTASVSGCIACSIATVTRQPGQER